MLLKNGSINGLLSMGLSKSLEWKKKSRSGREPKWTV